MNKVITFKFIGRDGHAPRDGQKTYVKLEGLDNVADIVNGKDPIKMMEELGLVQEHIDWSSHTFSFTKPFDQVKVQLINAGLKYAQ